MGLIITILTGIVLVEVYVWLPRLCEWIVRLAVRLLPHEHRERFGKEFEESQVTIPPSAWRLVHALSLIKGALSIRHSQSVSNAEEQFEQMGQKIAQVVANCRRISATIVTISARNAIVREIATLQFSRVAIQTSTLSPEPMAAPARSALSNAAQTLQEAAEKATSLFDTGVDELAGHLAQFTPLVDKLDRQWLFAHKLWGVCRYLPIPRGVILNIVISPLSRTTDQLSALTDDPAPISDTLERGNAATAAIGQWTEAVRTGRAVSQVGAPTTRPVEQRAAALNR